MRRLTSKLIFKNGVKQDTRIRKLVFKLIVSLFKYVSRLETLPKGWKDRENTSSGKFSWDKRDPLSRFHTLNVPSLLQVATQGFHAQVLTWITLALWPDTGTSWEVTIPPYKKQWFSRKSAKYRRSRYRFFFLFWIENSNFIIAERAAIFLFLFF